MTPEEFAAFEPADCAEEMALAVFRVALLGRPREALAATKEITNRTEGRPRHFVEVDTTGELERLVIRIQERYARSSRLS
jgi:hypothetical protein